MLPPKASMYTVRQKTNCLPDRNAIDPECEMIYGSWRTLLSALGERLRGQPRPETGSLAPRHLDDMHD